MANDVAIRVTNLSKEFRIGKSRGKFRYKSLRDSMASAMAAPFRRAASMARGNAYAAAELNETFWALRDVSFEVKQGEAVGIIGRNGAGKSTLLKVLSEITEPSEGEVELHGRVGSLLEVGTGFHPELSGRDNIYLNGAILGMKRAEINRKFDEIVDFAEVEKFIDTPVKHYSSGMYVRLAFAVAAHLEPEILVVDEVLAVGDAAFQKKCLGKMGDVAKGGRTVLFVSHNMTAIEALCSRCILIAEGRLRSSGEPAGVISNYLSDDSNPDVGKTDLNSHPRRTKNSTTIMREVKLHSGNSAPTGSIQIGAGLSILVQFSCEEKPFQPVLGVICKSGNGTPLFGINNRILEPVDPFKNVSQGTIGCHFSSLPLMPGTYYLDLFLGNPVHDLDIVHEAISFEVLPSDIFGTGKLPPPSAGPIVLPASWSLAE